ncbi:outer membrane beta-barrel protein [Fulvivirgaceae bacterium PWU4]|uniref:Outer membrane beta-barrel protein n=1 Tax=Chryseosolibacter histidini TaxID=2782349 RepID=A0AAP2GPT9_9BACT|nr:outer membrane beta-barrel protein [Chryseosolibacter histidini]MBT1697807.1 outer membrane beta-barrel protein [Chryseosolibacter histidini]
MKNFCCLLLCLLLATAGLAQSRKTPKLPKFNKNKEKNVFLKKQWWLAFKAGPNLSGAKVIRSYSAISPTNYEPTVIAKKYRNYKDLGAQATLEATFYFTGLSLSLQPTYRHNRFGYTNNYSWTDSENPENANNRLELKYVQQQKVEYFDLPILAKYEKMYNKISPYIQAGIYTSFLINANKSVDVSGVDYASGGENQFKNERIIVGASDLFAKKHWGLLGGAGIYLNQGNVRFNLDIMYKQSMSNIASTKNRFGSDRLSGVGDTMDDMKLSSVSITAGCLFPLRFLGRNFRSTDINK